MRRILPVATERLRFREMASSDLDAMSSLLGDSDVMAFYPTPMTREQSAAWIKRSQSRYAEDGHGLWIIETHDGEFVGDCGITWQSYNGIAVREIGYHVRADLQGRGYASEAAEACVALAQREFGASLLTAIIHPENIASRRVAEHVGMTHIADDHAHPWIVRMVLGMQLDSAIVSP